MTDESSVEGVEHPYVENLICPFHGASGQIMEMRRLGGYECPECGRRAELKTRWVETEPNHAGGDDE